MTHLCNKKVIDKNKNISYDNIETGENAPYILWTGGEIVSKRRVLHKLKYYRSKYNITQKEMAEMLEMSHSNYANIENGRTIPSFKTMLAIKNFINYKAQEAGELLVTLDDIFDS